MKAIKKELGEDESNLEIKEIEEARRTIEPDRTGKLKSK